MIIFFIRLQHLFHGNTSQCLTFVFHLNLAQTVSPLQVRRVRAENDNTSIVPVPYLSVFDNSRFGIISCLRMFIQFICCKAVVVTGTMQLSRRCVRSSGGEQAVGQELTFIVKADSNATSLQMDKTAVTQASLPVCWRTWWFPVLRHPVSFNHNLQNLSNVPTTSKFFIVDPIFHSQTSNIQLSLE